MKCRIVLLILYTLLSISCTRQNTNWNHINAQISIPSDLLLVEDVSIDLLTTTPKALNQINKKIYKQDKKESPYHGWIPSIPSKYCSCLTLVSNGEQINSSFVFLDHINKRVYLVNHLPLYPQLLLTEISIYISKMDKAILFQAARDVDENAKQQMKQLLIKNTASNLIDNQFIKIGTSQYDLLSTARK